MSGQILVGVGGEVHAVPDGDFLEALKNLPGRMASRLAFMGRDFVVREMPRHDRPLSPSRIAKATGLGLPRVSAVLADLERNLFFLVRDPEVSASWAFPVTTFQTRHRLEFSTGERTSGACAEDGLATSFVEGRLRGERLRVCIDSECHHCSRPLAIEVDDEFGRRVLSAGASPSSRMSIGAHSAARVSSTITERRPYSSGVKNTHANTATHMSSPAEHT
jgi:hypothetical protein